MCVANDDSWTGVECYMLPLIDSLPSASLNDRFDFVDSIIKSMNQQAAHACAELLLPRKLVEDIFIPTLMEYMREFPQNPYAPMWLAILPKYDHYPHVPTEKELLAAACQLAPNDEYIVSSLAKRLLHEIFWDCHHLPEGLIAPEKVIRHNILWLKELAASACIKNPHYFLEELPVIENALDDFAYRKKTSQIVPPGTDPHNVYWQKPPKKQ